MNLDANKEFEFEAYVYYVKDDDSLLRKGFADAKPSADAIKADVPKQKFLQSILFLSRQLTSAETRYWLTELKMTDIV